MSGDEWVGNRPPFADGHVVTLRNHRSHWLYAILVALMVLSSCRTGERGTLSDDPIQTTTPSIDVNGSGEVNATTSSEVTGIGDAGNGVQQTTIDVVEPDPDGADDVRSCAVVDALSVQLVIENSGSTTANYVVSVSFLDASEAEMGSEPVFVNHLRAGERARQLVPHPLAAAAADCEAIGSDRFEASGSPEALAHVVECQIVGEPDEGRIPLEVMVTNEGDDDSDYVLGVSVLADAIRVGEGLAGANIAAGQTETVTLSAFAGEAVDECLVALVERFPTP